MSLYRPVPPVPRVKNELEMDLTSIISLNPFISKISMSRGTMFSSSHIAQSLVIDGANSKRCLTGAEFEFGKGTFKHRLPCDAEVIKVIPKYMETMGRSSISNNPMNLIIYENIHTKEVGILELIQYSTAIDNKHQHFGFKYKFRPDLDEVLSKTIPEGTILGDSPAIDGFNGYSNYHYGVDTNIAFMSVPGIIEDGVVMSESYRHKIASRGFEKRVISWGKKYYPLNLYGNERIYKPFPDIGEYIRPDGLLFALRSFDDLLSPVEMDPLCLREPDYTFDKRRYAIPNARVVDINVQHIVNKEPLTPMGMEEQPLKYYESLKRYYTEILKVYQELQHQRRQCLAITPEFDRLLVEAIDYVGLEDNPITRHFKSNTANRQKTHKLYRRDPIDEWRVEVVFEYTVLPNVGHKITASNGDKGVICSVWPDADMPVDKDGNRADLIMDGDSTIKRMNVGRLYEHWINACSRDVSKRVVKHIRGGGSYQEAWDYLLSYYRTVAPLMGDAFDNGDYKESPEEHVKRVMRDGVYLWITSNSPSNPIELIKRTRDYFPPTFGPVTYSGGVVTDRNVLIGSLYIIVLEKTGVDWSGVSSARLQCFGILAKVSNIDKYSSPGRNNPIRILGEAEVRLMDAVVGSDVTADLLDQANSPTTHKAIVNRLLTTPTPTNINEIIDRRELPLGKSRSTLFVRHILECAGIEFIREIDDPIRAAEVDKLLAELYQ